MHNSHRTSPLWFLRIGFAVALASSTGCSEIADALHHSGHGHGHGGPGPTPNEVLYVSGNNQTILTYGLDTGTGALTPRATIEAGTSPSYLAFSPDKRFLFAIDENAGGPSSVRSYAIDPDDGALTLINVVPSGGSGAPHLAVHPSGAWLVVTHYGTGEISVLPIAGDGRVSDPSLIDIGPDSACMNAHQAVFDRSGDHLFVPCLGSDYVIQYEFDAGKISYNDPASVSTLSPRHLAFDPAEKHAYVISEYESTLTWYDYDAGSGRLTNPQSIPSYESTPGASAHVVVDRSGKWLYASNRMENSLGWFGLEADGTPYPIAFSTEGIATPRDFSIDPSGKFLILANQDGAQDLITYSINRADGELTPGAHTPAGSAPTFTGALALP